MKELRAKSTGKKKTRKLMVQSKVCIDLQRPGPTQLNPVRQAERHPAGFDEDAAGTPNQIRRTRTSSRRGPVRAEFLPRRSTSRSTWRAPRA